jgi:hypothetical protein
VRATVVRQDSNGGRIKEHRRCNMYTSRGGGDGARVELCGPEYGHIARGIVLAQDLHATAASHNAFQVKLDVMREVSWSDGRYKRETWLVTFEADE